MNQNNNIFKNSGIRGKAVQKNTFWHRLKNSFFEDKTTFFIFKNIGYLSVAISYYLSKKYNKSCNVIIATDTRTSSKWIIKYFQRDLSNFNHNIFNIGIAPTPFVAQSLTHYKPHNNEHFFQFGIMITASHNPAEYNGLKFFTPQGYLTEEEELAISKIFHGVKKNLMKYMPQQFDLVKTLLFKNKPKPFKVFDFYMHHLKQDINNEQFKKLKIVLDCANGVTYQVAQQIFESYGIQTIMINNKPNGNNINENSGCSNPELLINAVKQHDADWGCAFDGDGDRVIIVDNQGNVFDGDDIITVLAQHPKFKDQKTIVGTIMTNEAVAQYFAQQNKQFIRTDVGERNIIDALTQHNAQLGSESCGHITIMNHAPCSDGIYAALMFFDTLYSQQSINIPTYTKFTQNHATISLENKNITDELITQIKNKYATSMKPARIIIRKSNTEPLLRIMIEHQDPEQAKQVLTKIKNEFINT